MTKTEIDRSNKKYVSAYVEGTSLRSKGSKKLRRLVRLYHKKGSNLMIKELGTSAGESQLHESARSREFVLGARITFQKNDCLAPFMTYLPEHRTIIMGSSEHEVSCGVDMVRKKTSSVTTETTSKEKRKEAVSVA